MVVWHSNGIFYEFIPFNDQNFDEEGQLKGNVMTLKIDDIVEGKDYALLISTNAGAWRYLIGDVIKFVSKESSEIVIVGRTKHFLNLCGEHLSVENMNQAIQMTAQEMNVNIKEFSVVGERCDTLFAHRWYIGTDDQVDVTVLKSILDAHLNELNDDYRVERKAALKEIYVELLPSNVFYDWLKSQGKQGGQHKFPRVLIGDKLTSWKSFIFK